MSFFDNVAASFNMAISFGSLLTFVIYMVVATLLMAAHTKVYTLITPHDEFGLIRDGNQSAAVALAGAVIGFAIPMSNIISHSIGLLDFVIWAVIASCVQLVVFYVASKIVKGLSDRIVRNELGAAIFVAALAVSVGMLNAACMTPEESNPAPVINVIPAE